MVDSAWWSRGRRSETSAEEVGFVWGKRAERLGGQVGRRVPAGKSGAVSRIRFVFKRIVPQRLTHCRSGRVRGRPGDGGGRGGARRARRRRARRARMAPDLSARLPRPTFLPDFPARRTSPINVAGWGGVANNARRLSPSFRGPARRGKSFLFSLFSFMTTAQLKKNHTSVQCSPGTGRGKCGGRGPTVSRLCFLF